MFTAGPSPPMRRLKSVGCLEGTLNPNQALNPNFSTLKQGLRPVCVCPLGPLPLSALLQVADDTMHAFEEAPPWCLTQVYPQACRLPALSRARDPFVFVLLLHCPSQPCCSLQMTPCMRSDRHRPGARP